MSFSKALPSYSFDSFELSKDRRTTEQPKPILQHGLRPILIKITPHIFTILVIVSIVQLSFREQYWMDLVPPQQYIIAGLTQGGALNALQLAAKVVEMIILASLSFIIMFTAQRYLLGESGLPLGLMASPHQVITGELLRRKGFWSSWNTKSTFNGSTPLPGYTPRSGFYVFCRPSLVTVTGPSAAIAVIPSLDWFSMNKPFVSDPSPFYVFKRDH